MVSTGSPSGPAWAIAIPAQRDATAIMAANLKDVLTSITLLPSKLFEQCRRLGARLLVDQTQSERRAILREQHIGHELLVNRVLAHRHAHQA